MTRQRLVVALRSFEGTPYVFSVQGSGEAVALMEQIGVVLTDAGWVRRPFTSPGNPIFTSPGKAPAGLVSFVGLSIYVDNKITRLHPATVALRAALTSAHLQADARRIVDNTEDIKDAIHIYVGEKPRDLTTAK